MLVIRIELWPKGDWTRARLMGLMSITNVGGSKEVGNYAVNLLKCLSAKGDGRPPEKRLLFPKAYDVLRKGVVEGFARERLGPYDLLYRALASAVRDRSPQTPEPSDDETFGRETQGDEETV